MQALTNANQVTPTSPVLSLDQFNAAYRTANGMSPDDAVKSLTNLLAAARNPSDQEVILAGALLGLASRGEKFTATYRRLQDDPELKKKFESSAMARPLLEAIGGLNGGSTEELERNVPQILNKESITGKISPAVQRAYIESFAKVLAGRSALSSPEALDQAINLIQSIFPTHSSKTGLVALQQLAFGKIAYSAMRSKNDLIQANLLSPSDVKLASELSYLIDGDTAQVALAKADSRIYHPEVLKFIDRTRQNANPDWTYLGFLTGPVADGILILGAMRGGSGPGKSPKVRLPGGLKTATATSLPRSPGSKLGQGEPAFWNLSATTIDFTGYRGSTPGSKLTISRPLDGSVSPGTLYPVRITENGNGRTSSLTAADIRRNYGIDLGQELDSRAMVDIQGRNSRTDLLNTKRARVLTWSPDGPLELAAVEAGAVQVVKLVNSDRVEIYSLPSAHNAPPVVFHASALSVVRLPGGSDVRYKFGFPNKFSRNTFIKTTRIVGVDGKPGEPQFFVNDDLVARH